MPPFGGMKFGRYELVTRIGAGGMGEVWRAHDHELHRDVAVKFLPERFAADSLRLGRFAQEARAASSLNHPNIVTIHDFGETAGMPYIVMELVQGHTLREMVVDGRPLPVRRILEIGAQMADGLAKAHGAGIVHRDLKPENVMVTDDGYVKLLDFGLAKLRADASGERQQWFDTASPTWPDSPSPQTAAGVVLGTVGYMSPEQARGLGVDYRGDQFTLGEILYELATGRPAFRRETAAQTLAAIIEHSPEPIASINPNVPAPVRWVIEGRCLAREPGERYASTLDLARDLRQLREHLVETGGSMPARTDEMVRPKPGWRRPWLMPTLAVVVAAGYWLGPTLADRGRRVLGIDRLPTEKRIAVLPFDALSGSDEDRATAVGLVPFLTARLGALERFQKALAVEPAGSVLQLRVTTAAAARRTFGASLVLTGSVQRVGGGLLLTAALEDTERLRIVRATTASTYDGLAEAVVTMLDLELGAAARDAFRASATGVAEASSMTAQALGYMAYAEGRSALEGYEQQKSLEQAVTFFQRALERDPGYALAYAGLGEANWRLYLLTRDPVHVDLARKACERALRLNDLLAPVHVSLGVIRAGTGQPEAALGDFDRALALDPASADALREKSLALDRLGRPADAEAALRRAVELRPAYWANHNALGVHYWRHGDYAGAERAFRKVVELVPDNARGLANLGALLNAYGKPDEAVALLQRAMSLHPTYAAASNLALVEFDRGRYAEAVRAYEQALALDDRDYRPWRNLGIARFWTPGERPRAVAAFERAARMAAEQLKVSPDDAGVLADLADCQAHLGQTGPSRESLRRALRLAPGDVEVLAVAVSVYEQTGDRAAAFGALRKALKNGYPPELIEKDPGLAGLRADPRYRAPGTASDPAAGSGSATEKVKS